MLSDELLVFSSLLGVALLAQGLPVALVPEVSTNLGWDDMIDDLGEGVSALRLASHAPHVLAVVEIYLAHPRPAGGMVLGPAAVAGGLEAGLLRLRLICVLCLRSYSHLSALFSAVTSLSSAASFIALNPSP